MLIIARVMAQVLEHRTTHPGYAMLILIALLVEWGHPMSLTYSDVLKLSTSSRLGHWRLGAGVK